MGGSGCLLGCLVSLAICLAPAIFYALSMQKALRLAGPEHRSLEPAMVWLMFIPLFGMVWQFFVVKYVSDAVKSWAAANGQDVGDGGWTLGLVACILLCCSIVPLLGILASLGGLVCWIIWWVKVANFNAMMA